MNLQQTLHSSWTPRNDQESRVFGLYFFLRTTFFREFILSPDANFSDDAEAFVISFGIPYLLHRRFGDTSQWDAARLDEAIAFIKVKLHGQLNLYRLQMNPFSDLQVMKGSPFK